jgi:HemY protein
MKPVTDVSIEPETLAVKPVPPAAQDNSPLPASIAAAEPPPAAAPAVSLPPPAEAPSPAPLFRARNDIPKTAPVSIPAVIPIVRPPDDPGVDEDGPRDEFAEQIGQPRSQAGGWRGFWSRWGG